MGARRIRVGVIFGGRSGEHDVSLRSAYAILNAIDKTRFEAVPIGIARDGRWIVGGDPLHRLAATSRLALPEPAGTAGEAARSVVHAPDEVRDVADTSWVRDLDVIFPVLHGPMGEDGTIQGLLEIAGMPYVGAGVLASAVAMDKITAKRLFEQASLPLGPWFGVSRREWERAPARIRQRIDEEFGYPCFVKPANLGSSVGVTKVHESGELPEAMAEAGRHDRRIVVEAGLRARELEVSVLGNDDPISSIVGEIVPGREFYDYEAKYIDDSSELLIPAPISPEQSDEVRRIAVEAYKALDCAGMARVDFFLERDTGQVLINEVNTIPGFTQISMYPKLWEASGVSFNDLVTRLVELAIERYDERQGME
jgi:D-alanine-D-alanine ligase